MCVLKGCADEVVSHGLLLRLGAHSREGAALASAVAEGQAGQQRLHGVHVIQVELRRADALAHARSEGLAAADAGTGGRAAQDLVHHLYLVAVDKGTDNKQQELTMH